MQSSTMSSTKELICDLGVVLLIGIIFVTAEESIVQRASNPGASTDPIDNRPRGNCSCGGFNSSTPANGSEPLLAQSPGLVVVCDKEGANTCMALCVALATATKAKGLEMLCTRLKDCDELKLSAFYRTCENPWQYANMTAEQPLCCGDSKVKTCASAEIAQEQANYTTLNPVDAKTII